MSMIYYVLKLRVGLNNDFEKKFSFSMSYIVMLVNNVCFEYHTYEFDH